VRRLLVTGGAGFLGANFVRYWLACYPADRVVVLDALTYAGNRANLTGLDDQPGFRFVEGDIVDEVLVESLLNEERLNVVVNFAAESHVDRSITGPDPFIQTNVVGTHALLKACRRAWEGRAPHQVFFHHISTDEVFGSIEPDQPPVVESSPYAPNSPYSASKAASDHLVRAYSRTYGLPVTTSHCTNNYGPYQHPEKLIPRMMINALTGRPLTIYGDGA
jgi:dTDP-glucose 4,6-dehydratase